MINLLPKLRTSLTLALSIAVFLIILPLTYFSRSLSQRLSCLWSAVILRLLGCSYTVENAHHLLNEGAIYSVQHTSLLDTFIYPALLPSHTIYYAKSELKRIPIFGWVLHQLGHQFVERGGGQSQLDILRDNALLFPKNTALFIHPQGTRRERYVR